MGQLIQYFNSLSVTEGLMISVTVVLVLSLFALQRQKKQQQDQILTMQSLQRDLRALANAAVGVGGRVLEIERHQRKAPVIIPKYEQQPVVAYNTPTSQVEYCNSSSNQPYEQAIRMAQTGANIDDIVNVCGLSKSEAELVTMMHRLDKAS